MCRNNRNLPISIPSAIAGSSHSSRPDDPNQLPCHHATSASTGANTPVRARSRRSLVSIGAIQSGLFQCRTDAQPIMNDSLEGLNGSRRLSHAPDISADRRSSRPRCDYFCHEFQCALQVFAPWPARRYNRNRTGGYNFSKRFDIAGKWHLDYVGSTFNPAAYCPQDIVMIKNYRGTLAEISWIDMRDSRQAKPISFLYHIG